MGRVMITWEPQGPEQDRMLLDELKEHALSWLAGYRPKVTSNASDLGDLRKTGFVICEQHGLMAQGRCQITDCTAPIEVLHGSRQRQAVDQ